MEHIFSFLNRYLFTPLAWVVCSLALATVVAMVVGAPIKLGSLSLNAIQSEVDIAKDSARLIRQDASQRAILLVPRTDGKAAFSACSEPPPDMTQNIAQTLGSSLNASGRGGSQVEGSLDAQISKEPKSTAELLFQRSQGIQLLRDMMFRLCEGFQNNVIPPDDYLRFIRQLISTASVTIPFEQCTAMGIGMARFGVAATSVDTMVQRCIGEAVTSRESLTKPQPSPVGSPVPQP